MSTPALPSPVFLEPPNEETWIEVNDDTETELESSSRWNILSDTPQTWSAETAIVNEYVELTAQNPSEYTIFRHVGEDICCDPNRGYITSGSFDEYLAFLRKFFTIKFCEYIRENCKALETSPLGPEYPCRFNLVMFALRCLKDAEYLCGQQSVDAEPVENSRRGARPSQPKWVQTRTQIKIEAQVAEEAEVEAEGEVETGPGPGPGEIAGPRQNARRFSRKSPKLKYTYPRS